MFEQNSTNLAANERSVAPALSDLWSRALLRRLKRIEHGRLTVIAPDETVLRFGRAGTEPAATVALHHPDVARRLIFGGTIGFAEAYMDQHWDSADIVALILLAIANERALGYDDGSSIATRLVERVRHALRRNSRRGSERNITYHYDLGNAFYAAWLDPGMTYSAAMFEHEQESLEAAQERKYARVAALLDLSPGQSLLEIGCGWGGFAELAARTHGCRVTGLT